MLMTGAAKVVRALAAALCLAGPAACLSTTAVRYYTLAGEKPTGPLRRGDARYTVRVASARVPETLDRPELVMRVSATELAIDKDRKWSEPLRLGIARAVADSLGHDLLGALVTTAEDDTTFGDSDVEVSLDVRHLDLGLDASATIDVAWTARWARNGPTRSGRSVKSVPSTPAGGYDNAVAACEAVLAEVSSEIARSLRLDYLSGR
jgi:uncharacterized lipoprotein YmbA